SASKSSVAHWHCVHGYSLAYEARKTQHAIGCARQPWLSCRTKQDCPPRLALSYNGFSCCNRNMMETGDFIEKPLRVLHLEDDPDDAEIVKRRLVREELRPETTLVWDGDSFARALDAQRFDIILSDCKLAGYDGFEALALAHGKSPHTPFIFVCGNI